ncbi:MAG: 3'(2'),5'-bisphosphate nucleotidase CysQ family protein [Rickettsiales bacterium]
MFSNLPKLAQIAKETGETVLAMQKEIVANRNGEQETKRDGSVVTSADKKANQIICNKLADFFPGIPIVSEENSRESNDAALQADERFEIDPLDNTSGYVQGLDGFSVNIGRIRGGVPVAGAVYWPARKELYFTGDDGKAYLQKGNTPPQKISAKKLPLRTPLQAAVGFSERHLSHLKNFKYEIQKHPAQLRTCMVACGKCDITGINKGKGVGFDSWDTVGPHAILLAAGGDIVDTEGSPMRYNNSTEKLPDHIAGANNVLVALGLAIKSQENQGRSLP